MSEKLTEALKQRHQYHDWNSLNRLKEHLFVHAFHLLPKTIPGWKIARSRHIEQPGQPYLHSSTWVPDVDSPGMILRVESYESESLRAARELLLQQLGGLENIDKANRIIDTDIGDVAFSLPGNSGVIFSRANIVIAVTSVGTTPVSVIEFADLLDHTVFEKPNDDEAMAEQVDNLSLMAEEATDVAAGSKRHQVNLKGKPKVCAKYFSRQGEISREADKLFITGGENGAPEFSLFTTDSKGKSQFAHSKPTTPRRKTTAKKAKKTTAKKTKTRPTNVRKKQRKDKKSEDGEE